MSVPVYQNNGPISIPASLRLDRLPGKSVLVTGAASGLGKAYAQAFVKAGAYVTLVDFNEGLGKETTSTLGENAQFIKCDVTDWNLQVEAFEAAMKNSPQKSCDIVIANAGILGHDGVFALQDPAGPPEKPDVQTINTNLIGMLYTAKLAIHYFRRQPLDESRDRCLILKSSLAGYIDAPGWIQYNASKFGVRGVMRCLRRTSWKESIRVNLVAPWFVRTPILPEAVQKHLVQKGFEFALVEDCCHAMLFIASDTTINGRALSVVPRQYAHQGYLDLDLDDYEQGSLPLEWQKIVLQTASDLAE